MHPDCIRKAQELRMHLDMSGCGMLCRLVSYILFINLVCAAVGASH